MISIHDILAFENMQEKDDDLRFPHSGMTVQQAVDFLLNTNEVEAPKENET